MKKKHMIDFLFPVALLFVFAVSALSVLLFATNIYEHSVETSARNNNARTSIAYVTEKVHQTENAEVSVGELDGCDALVIRQTIKGQSFVTYIYASDGELRELFTKPDFVATSDLGNKILPVDNFSIEKINDRLIKVECSDGAGKEASALVGLG